MSADKEPALFFIILLFSVIILIESSSDSELEFLSEPSSQLVKPSDGRAVFRCNVSPPSAEVRWLWRGHPVVHNRWIKMSRHKLTVHLGKTDRKSKSPHNLENGSFQCEARLKGKVLVSAPAKLIIAVLDPFLPQSDIHISVTRGNTAVIPCNPPHSVPAVVTEFRLNGTVIDRSTNDHQLMPSGNLQIFDAKSSESGEYVCAARNPYLSERTEARNKIILSVIDPSEPRAPFFVVHPPSKTFAVLGSNITLECVVNGYPVPTITWRRHHGHLPKWRFKQIGGNLFLFGVRRGDEGTYHCEADNSVGGQLSKSTEIHVQETPQITKAPQNVAVEAGENFTLQCVTRGHPKPMITWIHNGKTVLSEHGKESQLVMHDANHRHSGIYQCFANNDLGSTYAMCLVTVTSGNKTIDLDYENDYEDYDIDSELGSQFNHKNSINVAPKGHNPNEYESDTNNNNSETDGSVANKRRKKKKSKGVKLVPPSRPEITRLSDTSVMVRWGVPRNDGLPILFFKVQYREVGRRNSQWMTIDEDIAAHIHSYAVMDLKTGGRYRFRIAAVYSNNDNKLGPNSAKFTLFKDPPMKKPTLGPRIIHAEAASPSAITLQWEYNEIDSVSIEGFFIYYRATHSAGDYLKITVLGANTRSHIISHLLPETAYDIKTQCFNIAGTSEFSNIYTCKTKPSEALGPRSRSSKPQHSEEEILGMSQTKPVSSKNADGNSVIYIVLGVVCTVMLIASSVFIILCIRQRQNQHPDPVVHSVRETPLKTNGHLSSNGYIAVGEKVNISVNPLSHLDSDDSNKADQFDDVLSNNNEIIRMQTFSENIEQQEPLLIHETSASGAAAGGDDRDQENEQVNVPNDCDTSAEVPRSI